MSGARALAALTALAAAVGVAAAADLARPSPADSPAARDFRRMTGGLGSGPGLDFSGCAAAFDARTGETCRHGEHPLVGGAALCPFCGDASPR